MYATSCASGVRSNISIMAFMYSLLFITVHLPNGLFIIPIIFRKSKITQ